MINLLYLFLIISILVEILYKQTKLLVICQAIIYFGLLINSIYNKDYIHIVLFITLISYSIKTYFSLINY